MKQYELHGCGRIYNGSCFDKEVSLLKNENNHIPISIDFNLSQILLDSGNCELVTREVEDSQGTNANGLFLYENKHNPEAQKISFGVESSRQSTRN